jgi:hypothetical protein
VMVVGRARVGVSRVARLGCAGAVAVSGQIT